MLFDTHCHLSMNQFKNDITDVVERAKNKGVNLLNIIGTEPSEWQTCIDIARGFGFIASLAFSPHDAKLLNKENFNSLEYLLDENCVKGVGETGLDYHYFNSPKESQIASFEKHIELAERKKLPLIVHSRDAFDDTLSILKGIKTEVIIHCFTYGRDEAEKFILEGFYLSFSGIVTFNNSNRIQEAAKRVPIDKLLIETDSPYLSPIPYRGKRCEPSFLFETSKFLSKLKMMNFDEFSGKTTRNGKKIFGLDEGAR